MTAPVLLNAIQIAWVRLLEKEEITSANLETAPMRLVAAVLLANSQGVNDPAELAEAAVSEWTTPSVTLN